MELFFTPVKGKQALVLDWATTKFNEQQAKEFPGATGIAVVLGLSNIVALDLDDLEWCIKQFQNINLNINQLLEGHFEIISPKANRRKILCKAPTDIELSYLKLPPKDKGSKLELRAGNRYDVWAGSVHPEGGLYTAGMYTEIKELPTELKDFWLQCMQYRVAERSGSSGTGEVPLIGTEGSMSVIHVYNVTHTLTDTLKSCGYSQRGDKWQSPHSTSGSYGLSQQMSYLNPWDVCYSHHASDGELANRPMDAFEIAAAFAHPDKDLNVAKLIFTSEQSKILHAIDDEEQQLPVTVHAYNNPVGERTLLDLVDVKDPKDLTKTPEFVESIISSLPDPIPLLLKNFKECIYEPVPAMFGPAFMTLHEVLLQSKVRTIRDRSVNCSYANGSLSGGGKDDNSVEAANRYLKEFRKLTIVNTTTACQNVNRLLNPITTTFTSGNNLLQTLHNAKVTSSDTKPLGGVMMSAEATSFYRTLADTKNHYAGNAIIDVEIACFNGQIISASKVSTDSNKHMEDIVDPNFSFFRLTQLDPFKQAFNVNLVEKGYYGRLFETYDVREDAKYIPTGSINNKVFNFEKEGFEFILDMATKLEVRQTNIQVQCNTVGSVINEWETKVIGEGIYPKLDVVLFPGIKRIPQIAEKWVSLVTAYNFFWLEFKGLDTSHLILKRDKSGEVITLDGSIFESSVVPMMDYLASVKWYTLHAFVVTSDASELDIVLEGLWQDCVKQTLPDAKRGSTYGNWLKVGSVPLQMFSDKVKKKKEILRILNGDVEKMQRVMTTWINNKGLKVSHNVVGAGGTKRKTCLVEKFSG